MPLRTVTDATATGCVVAELSTNASAAGAIVWRGADALVTVPSPLARMPIFDAKLVDGSDGADLVRSEFSISSGPLLAKDDSPLGVAQPAATIDRSKADHATAHGPWLPGAFHLPVRTASIVLS